MIVVPLISAALLLAACGGSSDSDDAGSVSASTPTPASSQGASDTAGAVSSAEPSTTGAATTGTAASVASDPATTPVDPASADPCSILSLDEVSAATGDTASDPVNYNQGSDQVAECNWYLASGASLGFQIELQLPPGSQSVNDGRPFSVGTGGRISDGAGYPFAMTDINGWLVKLSGLSGEISEEQLVAVGRLLEQRLISRDASTGGAMPAGPSGDGSGDGTCSVQVTGALNAEFTSGQDIGEAYASVWVPDEEEAMADSMFPGGAPDFQLGCSSDGDQSVLITLFDVDVPLGATSVMVPDNQAGFFSDDGLVGNRGAAEIALTRFDETAIAGSITFTGDGLGTGESTVTMTFDFTNDWAA
jgi:hypothetical protein